MHSQAPRFRGREWGAGRGQGAAGPWGWGRGPPGHCRRHLLAPRRTAPRRPRASTQAHSCSLWTTSSLGLAPPKIAELGLATWLRGVATVRGLSWSRGLCALSSSVGSLKSMLGPRSGGPSLKRLPIGGPARRSPGRLPPLPPRKSSLKPLSSGPPLLNPKPPLSCFLPSAMSTRSDRSPNS